MDINSIIEQRRKLRADLGPLPPHYTDVSATKTSFDPEKFMNQLENARRKENNQKLRGRFVHSHKNKVRRQHRLGD